MSTDINTTNPVPFNTENTMDKKKYLYIQYKTFNESFFKDGTILYPTELQNKIEQDLKER